MVLHTINNKAEQKILRTKAVPFDFSKFTKPEIRRLVKEMRLKMIEWHGVGLAANQVGMNISLFVARTDEKFYAIFNPEITERSGEELLLEEGCLSVPGLYGMTPRYEKVILQGQDQNGKKIKIKAWGLLAHVFQHETDHLLGKLYIDTAKRTYTAAESDRLKKLKIEN